MIFVGVNEEYRGHVKTMYPRGLGCLFTKTIDEIWDFFFEYLADDTWEYENARETFNLPSPDPYVVHATPFDKSQFEGISYEHSHTPSAPISYDYCYSFDHDVDTFPLLSRPHRLQALAAFNREFYLQSLLKIDLSTFRLSCT